MILNKCPYELSEDYVSILSYLNKNKKCLFALFQFKETDHCLVACCGLAYDKVCFMFENTAKTPEYVEKDNFVEYCKNKKIRFILP